MFAADSRITSIQREEISFLQQKMFGLSFVNDEFRKAINQVLPRPIQILYDFDAADGLGGALAISLEPSIAGWPPQSIMAIPAELQAQNNAPIPSESNDTMDFSLYTELFFPIAGTYLYPKHFL